MAVKILKGFQLPAPKPGGEIKFHWNELQVGGDPMFIAFGTDKKKRVIARVQGSARSWCSYREDGAQVVTRVVNDPETGDEGIAVWRIK